jgi:Na+-transporting NADH:ubiquinone oxidoreductase subunit NqrB
MTKYRLIAVAAMVAVIAIFALATDIAPWRIAVGVLVAAVLFRIGYAMLSGLAQPVPEPPEAGTLRKVKLVYRCSICGTEVRMTAAATEDPEPPRHCLEDMDLVSPIE